MIPLLLILSGPAPSPSPAPLEAANAPVAAFVEARDMLAARRFGELTAILERLRSSSSLPQTIESAGALDWRLAAFGLLDAKTGALLDEWVRAEPKSSVPLLARAVHHDALAIASRGEKFTSETTPEQFRGMAEALVGMRTDCRAVLEREPKACDCHATLVAAAPLDSGDPEALFKQAFKVCPKDYALHAAHVSGLTPRWGGSYEEMRAAIELARRSGLDAPHLANLAGYIPTDQSLTLEIDGRMDEAERVLDEAVATAPSILLIEERAEFRRRKRKDPAGTLAATNEALAASHGGWSFGPDRLTRLLIARTYALQMLGRTSDAQADLALAGTISPDNKSVKFWQNYFVTYEQQWQQQRQLEQKLHEQQHPPQPH